jgi:2-keto-4-pentenoate hydratase/2-oxohepta-3-ene-1,7-dioic acid hydratase in catechol pathway
LLLSDRCRREPEYQVDYEVELAVVIGGAAHRVTADGALDDVFGYTVVNDVNSRYIQLMDNQITLGKGFSTSCPLEPEIVLKDEIPDPSWLTVMTRVNGEQDQASGTDRMLFLPQRLIEAFSRHVPLFPGDVIATGTPAGVWRWRTSRCSCTAVTGWKSASSPSVRSPILSSMAGDDAGAEGAAWQFG